MEEYYFIIHLENVSVMTLNSVWMKIMFSWQQSLSTEPDTSQFQTSVACVLLGNYSKNVLKHKLIQFVIGQNIDYNVGLHHCFSFTDILTEQFV